MTARCCSRRCSACQREREERRENSPQSSCWRFLARQTNRLWGRHKRANAAGKPLRELPNNKSGRNRTSSPVLSSARLQLPLAGVSRRVRTTRALVNLHSVSCSLRLLALILKRLMRGFPVTALPLPFYYQYVVPADCCKLSTGSGRDATLSTSALNKEAE